MIQVSLVEGEDGYLRAFSMKGHAGFADSGRDIVCAAVSMLAINTVNAIETLLNGFPMKVRSDSEKGSLDCTLESEPSRETELLLRTMVLGFKGVRDTYGKEFINIEFIKER